MPYIPYHGDEAQVDQDLKRFAPRDHLPTWVRLECQAATLTTSVIVLTKIEQ